MSIQYRVNYLTQRVQVTDPLCGLVIDKEVKFPSFSAAVSFARDVQKQNDSERVVGKPVIEQVN